VKLRILGPADQPALEGLHRASGLDFCLPSLADPLVVLAAGVERGGRLALAGLARLTAELYLVTDRSVGTPAERLAALVALQAAGLDALWRRGLADAHCWLPPPVARSFGRRLARLGWVREDWPCYWRPLGPPNLQPGKE
jgi:hypothetical protein